MATTTQRQGEKRKQDVDVKEGKVEKLPPSKRTRVEHVTGGSEQTTTEGDIHKYRTNPEFLVALVHTRVEQLRLPENKVFVAERKDKIIDVFKGLVKHNFLSVPVLQAHEHKWWGFVDMNDIVHFIIKNFGDRKLSEEGKDFWQMLHTEEEFAAKTVDDIMQWPMQRKNLFHPVKVGYSLFYAIEALAKERDLHRLVVIDDDRMIVNMVTQSQVVDFLQKNIDLIGDKVNKPLSAIPRLFHEVYSVPESVQAIDAFNLMVSKNVSGVAIVNEEGKLTGNISNRDLKGIATDGSMFWRMFSKVHNFWDKVRRESEQEHPRGVVALKSTNTLKDVITKLTENKVHRLYIVDDDRKPIGVVSLRDILYEIIVD
jgi:5'-AMP-activated protein kinase regulatory gamma subunit